MYRTIRRVTQSRHLSRSSCHQSGAFSSLLSPISRRDSTPVHRGRSLRAVPKGPEAIPHDPAEQGPGVSSDNIPAPFSPLRRLSVRNSDQVRQPREMESLLFENPSCPDVSISTRTLGRLEGQFSWRNKTSFSLTSHRRSQAFEASGALMRARSSSPSFLASVTCSAETLPSHSEDWRRIFSNSRRKTSTFKIGRASCRERV